MRLDELSFEIRLEGRTTKGSSSGRITLKCLAFENQGNEIDMLFKKTLLSFFFVCG